MPRVEASLQGERILKRIGGSWGVASVPINMAMKRETSISVTDLQQLSSEVKRISLREEGGSGGNKGTSSTTSPARENSKTNSPIQDIMSGLPSFQVQAKKTALFPAEVGESGLAVRRSSDDGESISSKSKQENVIGSVNQALDNRKSLEKIASRASSMVQVGSVLDKMTTNESFLNKYEFLNEIGRGGFSRVFRCRSRKREGEEYAVKVIDLRPMRLKERFDPARLRREVDIMQKLRHPHIVHFFEGYETDDSVLMVLELCPGKELFDVILERNSFSEADAKPVFSQVCSAVYYLHCLNIIHRDIKPENILVLDKRGADGNLVVKLLDFGLSKNAGAGSEAKTFVGTPCYLAPEVEFTSKGLGGTYGLPADCWSLGAVLYVMLVARFPEFEQDPTGKVVLKLPQALWSHITPEAKALVNGLMNTNQYARLTSAAALQQEWLGSYRMTGEQLGKQAAAVVELGQGLQEDLDKDVSNTEVVEDGGASMTAGGANIHPTEMVLRRGHEYGHGQAAQSSQLQLAPLFQLQKSIASCFEDAHASYRDIPEVASDIRAGAVLCRNQFQESMKMLYKVEQTSAAVLDMFPDLELAVEEGVPQLAHEFFGVVKGWVTELRTMVSSTQQANQASMMQIQTIVERSTMGLKNKHRHASLPGSMKLPKGVISMVQKQLTDGSDIGDRAESDVHLSTDQVLELFLGLFGQMQPKSPSRGSHMKSNSGAALNIDIDERPRSLSRELPEDVVDLDMEADESYIEDVYIDDGVMDTASSESRVDAPPSSTSPPFRPANLAPIVLPTAEESASSRPNGSGSNSKRDATLTAIRDLVSGTSTTVASARLSEALDKLHEVDIILEQLSAFWTNTEVVLDRLTKKGEHVEQFIAFSQKPKLLARFQERMEEYKRFWEGVNQLCKNFTRPGEQAGTGGAKGSAADGTDQDSGFGKGIYTMDSVSSFNSTMHSMGSKNYVSSNNVSSASSRMESNRAPEHIFTNLNEAEARSNIRADSLS